MIVYSNQRVWNTYAILLYNQWKKRFKEMNKIVPKIDPCGSPTKKNWFIHIHNDLTDGI